MIGEEVLRVIGHWREQYPRPTELHTALDQIEAIVRGELQPIATLPPDKEVLLLLLPDTWLVATLKTDSDGGSYYLFRDGSMADCQPQYWAELPRIPVGGG